jgi:hypothetical protein
MFRFLTAVWAAMAGVSVAFAAYSASAQETDLVDRVRAAWRVRQEKVKSFDAKWQMSSVNPRGSRLQASEGGPIPAEDRQWTIDFRLVTSGKQIKYTRKGEVWDEATNGYTPEEFVKVFDGQELREVSIMMKADQRPAGWHYDNGKFDDGDDWRIQPLVLALRPLVHAAGAPHVSRWRATLSQRTVGPRRCRIIELDRKLGTERLLVDPSAGYVVIGRELEFNGVLLQELRIDYEDRAGFGPLPASWTCLLRDPSGTVTEVRTVSSVDLRLNDRIDPAEFEFAFPPRTLVSHEGTGLRSIVRWDGSLRPVTSGELAAIPYDDLMELDPAPEAIAAHAARKKSQALIWISSAMALVLAGAYVWYRRTRQAGAT